jgi:hypothetical protein
VRVWVTYKTGFGLDDLIYCTLYIHTARNYRQYSAIAILHTLQFIVTHALGFSVFTSRILATDPSQSHCNFKSHMMSSLHRLISSLGIILRLPIMKSRLCSFPLLPTTVLFSSSQVKFALRLTVGQSVFVSIENYSPVHMGHSLWREDGSVVCHSESTVINQLSVCTTIYILHV